MDIIVPDASVLLKWLLPSFDEKDTEKALALRNLYYNVTFYDAAYHASALVERGLFVTADHKYAQKAKDAGGVITLEDWHKTCFS